MDGEQDLSTELGGPCDCRIEVVDFEPEEHAVSVRLGIWISHRTVVVLHLLVVQLRDQALAAVLGALPFRSTRRS